MSAAKACRAEAHHGEANRERRLVPGGYGCDRRSCGSLSAHASTGRLLTALFGANSVVGWTISLMRPYSGRVGVLAGLSLAEVLLRALTPWPLKAVVDHVGGGAPAPAWLRPFVLPVSTDGRLETLTAIVILAVVIQLAHQLVLMLHTRLHVRIGQSMVYALRSRLFAHLQNLSLKHHERMPKGDTVYRLEADATCIEHLLLKGIFPIAFSTLTLIVMFVVLATFNLRLAVVSLSIAPMFYVVLRLQSRHLSTRADRTRKLEARLVERAYESFSSIRLIKGFAREPHEVGRFSGAATAAMQARLDLTQSESRYSLVIGAVSALGGVAVLGVGGMQVADGTITVGTLLVVMMYLGYVYGPMTAIANLTGSIQQALAGARRVYETLELPVERDPADAISARHLTGHVVFEDVRFGYEAPDSTICGVSFSAAPGEMVALVGPSGAGKTTLVSLLMRMYDVQGGRLLIDGVDIRRYRLQSLREQVAIVLQEAVLLSGTVGENIRYGKLDASPRDIQAAADAAGASEFIERLPQGYDTEMAEAGAGLSGGERQRLSIARAFLKNAPILILDEPTASLDALNEARVLDAVRRLRNGRTTFVIAHRLSTVREADKILMMDAGRIVAEGRHSDLLVRCPLYAEMCSRLAQGQAA
jgi:ATP-binding cassette subfamily B protein